MRLLDDFQEGFVNAVNHIRHTVVEEPYFVHSPLSVLTVL
jgi:hypothetical protein